MDIVARYMTDEKIRWCFSCRAKFTEREMIKVDYESGYTSQACPSCGEVNITTGPTQEYNVVGRVRNNAPSPIRTFTVT